MEFIRNNIFVIAFTLLGAVGGFLYWKFVGCQSGTCPIKSVWYWSTLYGALIGGLTGSLVKDVISKYNKKRNQADDQ